MRQGAIAIRFGGSGTRGDRGLRSSCSIQVWRMRRKTTRRCIEFARSWGYGSVEIVNLFAYRTPYPKELSKAVEPIGIENDRYLRQASNRSRGLVFAWGNWGYLRDRAQQVCNLLAGKEGYCLGLTRTGQPRHPLYLPKNTQLMPYRIDP
jgi:hypothetical protein